MLMTGVGSSLTISLQRGFRRPMYGEWKNWDGDINSLQADRQGLQLNAQETVHVYQGAVSAGQYSVGLGYRLSQGTVVFNVEGINFGSE